jgi:nickel-dependent lactate racemase
MTRPEAQMGTAENNPVRQDIEEIGRMMGLDLIVNAILNHDRETVQVLAGEAGAVMEVGVPLARQICQLTVNNEYDLLICSPGGHPKDINVYQSQKALAHAARITKPGGTILLVAACPDGSGSASYEKWVIGKTSNVEVMEKFVKQGFQIGPHKAYLIARDAARHRLISCTDLDVELAKGLLLNPVKDLQTAIDLAVKDLKPGNQIGVMPNATSTIPRIEKRSQQL